MMCPSYSCHFFPQPLNFVCCKVLTFSYRKSNGRVRSFDVINSIQTSNPCVTFHQLTIINGHPRCEAILIHLASPSLTSQERSAYMHLTVTVKVLFPTASHRITNSTTRYTHKGILSALSRLPEFSGAFGELSG